MRKEIMELIKEVSKDFNSNEFLDRKKYALYITERQILDIEHYKDNLKSNYRKDMKSLNDWQNNLYNTLSNDYKIYKKSNSSESE